MTCLVLGAGVNGLSCAIRLLEAGFSVIILASERHRATTSYVAAAIWYPYLSEPEEKVKVWSHASFEEFKVLSQVANSGVTLCSGREFFSDGQKADPFFLSTVASTFRRVRKDEFLFDRHTAGFALTVPVADMGTYLEYLETRFTTLGGEFRQCQTPLTCLGDIASQVPITSISAIVNCLGLGSREVMKDNHMSSVRGQVVVVEAVNGVNDFIFDDYGDEISYIIPRGDKTIVLGGTCEKGTDENITPQKDITAQILTRCANLVPALRGAMVLEEKVGLRPCRSEVRLEHEFVHLGPSQTVLPVVHNYGHGGSGMTLSWGCARDVVDKVKTVLK